MDDKFTRRLSVSVLFKNWVNDKSDERLDKEKMKVTGPGLLGGINEKVFTSIHVSASLHVPL